jgi:addiction module HigA family antidote
MIISFRDKRTRAFFEGERVQAFQGFERQAILRLDRLHAADRLMALNTPGNRLEGLRGIAKASTASASMINGGFALNGRKVPLGRLTRKLRITIRRLTMTRLLIHPGEHLADELKALGMSANELAKELGVPTNRITQIIRGKRGITGDTALRLGRWFGTGPDIWMNLQKNYELRLAAQEIGDALQKIPQRHGKAKTSNDLHP